jgi:superfamily II DNA or RNA helicase
VRRFLERQTSDIKVVFSTYQSSPVVGEGARGLPAFDLAIFDEAHKTIGRGDSALRFAISDENIRIKKRLFLTATPRHIDIRHRNKEGEFRVCSMDDEAVYGPRSHTLSFGKAAETGIICRYKVIISLIDKEMVDDFTRKQGITLVERDEVGARWMANLIAVRQAIERVEAKKIISFHSRVRLAQEFASKEPQGIAYHLTDYDVRHVNGEQSSGDRGDIIREFAGAPKALLSNARCLTEGINIPAVDMVAFVDPRQSRIDITQAVGRAMRKPRGPTTKTVGYVVVPVFAGMEETDSLESAIKSEKFEAVVDVLNSLQEHDDELVDIIREIKQRKGEGEPFNPRRLYDKVEVLGPRVDLARLTASISVEIADRIGSSWDEMFGKLLLFREQHDHCRVPSSYSDATLCTWVEKNRSRQRAGMLKVDRERALNEIGFDWYPIPNRWRARYVQLKGWREAKGHCCPARNSENKELATWVSEQRLRYKSRKMSVDEKKKLDEIGFVFNFREAAWLESYESLKSFFKQRRHSNVPLSFSKELVSWIRIQRKHYAQGKLDKKQIEALNAVKISWNPIQESWDAMFAKLKIYSERRSIRNVRIIEMDGELSRWLVKQRAKYRKGRLDDVSSRKLESIGISWSPDAEFWDAMYEKLVRAKAKKGNCHISYDYPDKRLFDWVTNQRAAKKKGILAPDRIKRLEAIGFVWDTVLGIWDRGFAALEAFKAREGDCLVPQRHIEGKTRLGSWVNLQRSNKGTMPAERKRKLEAIGFVWEPRKAGWEKGFSALRVFKVREKHCNVPQRHLEGDFKLGVWVNGQRTNKMKLTVEYKKRLNEIGFIWRVK